MRELLRDYLKLAADAAAGAAGEFRRRAESGARELVELSGLDPEQLRAKVPASVQSLAEEIVGAGRTNSELLIGLVRSEAEKAWSRLGDGMVHVGVVLELLERQVRALQGGEEEATPSAAAPKPEPDSGTEPGTEPKPKPASRAEQAFPGRAPRPVRVVVDPEDGAASAAAAAAARRRAAVPGMRKVAEGRGAAASAPAPARKAAAKKAPAKTATAKKATAEQAPVKKAAAKKTVAKTAAKKTVAKTATAEQAPAKTAATKKTAAKKTATKTAATKTAAKKQTTAKKAPARKPRQAQESAADE